MKATMIRIVMRAYCMVVSISKCSRSCSPVRTYVVSCRDSRCSGHAWYARRLLPSLPLAGLRRLQVGIRTPRLARRSMSIYAPRITGLLTSVGLLLSPLGSSPSAAQEQVLLTGVVADEAASTPVASAKVTVVGTGLQTYSQANGTFAFPDAPLGPVLIRVEAPGFTSLVQEVVVRRGAVVFVQFILPKVHAFLDELLVVGRRGERAPALSEVRSAADLLAGQIPGVTGNSGIVGQNRSPVLLRGVRSFSLGGEPDIYLDGVRMAGGFGEALSLLRQIPASDVRDIQILRGPAAAFLHGSADGVIHVRTKSGRNE